jgi:hypothetical protein
MHFDGTAPGWIGEVTSPVFISPEAMNMAGYGLYASPTIYPGQVLNADIIAHPGNPRPVRCQIFLAYYGANDQLEKAYGPQENLTPGKDWNLEWKIEIPEAPVARIAWSSAMLRSPKEWCT